ncbi:MAG: glycosyltransferase family protein [Planctomycetota bacterium]|jgi:glycosyltransferase involved in cell wall biosynthesis
MDYESRHGKLIMPYNIRIVSTYPPRRCGIGTFSRDLATALGHFTSEVGNIRVAAIDNGSGPYRIPVEFTIDQNDPASWRDATSRIISRAKMTAFPTIVLLQHEYGLDPDEKGASGRGTNFVEMAKTFTENGLTTLVYLHTVLEQPDEHQKKVLQDLAACSDGLVVTTENAINILESPAYEIPHAKLKHIDHGIRMQQRTQYDRLEIKRRYGLDNRFLITTLGLLSPGKGIQYSLRAYGKFLQESCTEAQRSDIVYLVAGRCHPEFIKADGGKPYRQFEAELTEALEESNLKSCKVKDLQGADLSDCDVVFLDVFLDETTLVELYCATNVMVLPYLNMQQISSGILADTLGSGRVAITTKFRYAVELVHSNKVCPKGTVIGRYARSILVDPGEPSVEQIARGLDFLVFNESKRLVMEKQAHQRGYQMRWNNSAWALLQYVDFVREQKEIVTGRGVKFTRERPSTLEIKKRRTP